MSRVVIPQPGQGIVSMSGSRLASAPTYPASRQRRALLVAVTASIMLLLSQLAGVAATRGLLPAGLAPASAAAAQCVNGWRELNLPADAFTRSLFSIVTYNDRPKWLLGGSHRSGTLALRYIDGKWRRVPTGSTGTRGFTAGSALTRSKAITVGYDNPRNDDLRATGGRLSTGGYRSLGVPRLPGGNGSALSGVVARGAKNAWAIGTRWVKGKSKGTALLWNGKTWVRRDPGLGGGESALTSVHRAANGPVWAVGWQQRFRGEFRPVIRRRSNGKWREVTPAPIARGVAIFTDVYFAGKNDGWVTGYLIKRGTFRYVPQLQHWDGTGWTRVDLPWGTDHSWLPRAVTSDGKGNVWMAGVRLPKTSAEGRGFVAKLVDGEWSLQELNVPNSVPSDLRDIALTATGAMAVGAVASTSFAMETCGPAATRSNKRIAVSRMAARIAVPGIEDHDEDVGGPEVALTPGALEPAGLGKPVTSGVVRFADVAGRVNVREDTKTWGGVIADVNKDGWKDIWYSRHLKRPPRMLLGGPTGFRKAPAQPWTIGDRHGCDAADIDKDGAREVYCAFGGVRGTGVGRHELSLRVGKGDAETPHHARGAYDPFGRGREAVFINLDKDGYPDLFVTSNPERVDGMPSTNRFFKNVDGWFVPAPEVGLDHSTGARCVWVGDIDKDGDEDMLHCQTRPNDSRGKGVRFYRNEGGKLRDRTGARRIRPMDDIAVAVADVTGDRRKDLIQLSKTKIRVSAQTSTGFSQIFEARLTDGVDLAVGDVNKDKRADIYVLRGGRGNARDRMLISKSGGRRWQSVKIPHTAQGDADAVLAIDHDNNGRMDFLVLNGKNEPGPVQLIASYRK